MTNGADTYTFTDEEKLSLRLSCKKGNELATSCVLWRTDYDFIGTVAQAVVLNVRQMYTAMDAFEHREEQEASPDEEGDEKPTSRWGKAFKKAIGLIVYPNIINTTFQNHIIKMGTLALATMWYEASQSSSYAEYSPRDVVHDFKRFRKTALRAGCAMELDSELITTVLRSLDDLPDLQPREVARLLKKRLSSGEEVFRDMLYKK